MKYGATIQDLAARGHNWRYYDENFVFCASLRAPLFPGGLYIGNGGSQINAKKSIPATGVAKNLDVPQGYCFKFHKGGYCSGCSLSTHVLSVMVHIRL